MVHRLNEGHTEPGIDIELMGKYGQDDKQTLISNSLTASQPRNKGLNTLSTSLSMTLHKKTVFKTYG